MPRYRALVSTFKSTEMAADRIVNTVYFDDHGVTTDADGLAEDIATLFGEYRVRPQGWDRVNCRLYDMAEPTPREIQGEATVVTSASSATGGPREVALCLSFFSERNLPRNRGRIYLGPWFGSQMNERPADSRLDECLALYTGLTNIGGTDVEWCVFSPTTPGSLDDKFKPVTAGWCDNEWDTQRSRGLKATVRTPIVAEG